MNSSHIINNQLIQITHLHIFRKQITKFQILCMLRGIMPKVFDQYCLNFTESIQIVCCVILESSSPCASVRIKDIWGEELLSRDFSLVDEKHPAGPKRILYLSYIPRVRCAGIRSARSIQWVSWGAEPPGRAASGTARSPPAHREVPPSIPGGVGGGREPFPREHAERIRGLVE